MAKLMYRIAKRFHFAASHQLTNLPESHKCHRLHGHNYEVEFVLSGPLVNGMVRDYGDLDPAKDAIAVLDHRHLNDFMIVPSAEIIAWWLFQSCYRELPELVAVRVFETASTWAEYTP